VLTSCVTITLDSLRYDVARAALPDVPWEERTAWGTWTLPSHLMLGAGLLPFRRHTGLAVDYYRSAYRDWSVRMGTLIKREPEMWLPTTLRRLGIRTGTVTSLPCLNRAGQYGRGWNLHYPVGLDAAPEALGYVLDAMNERKSPWWWVVNLGATHYPYGLDLPRLSGLHGNDGGRDSVRFDADQLRIMKSAQARLLLETWELIQVFRAELPTGTTLIVTSDHGELFGEHDLFGHGPFDHPALRAVPYWEVRA